MNKGLFLVILAALTTGVYLWEQNQALRMGYRVQQLLTERQRLVQENGGLRYRESTLASLERLSAVAAGHGLQVPSPDRIERLPSL